MLYKKKEKLIKNKKNLTKIYHLLAKNMKFILKN